MALLDLLGRRWTLRVLWELRDGEPLTYRALQDACDEMSSSVLRDRLRELTDARLVERVDGGYVLSRDGIELQGLIRPLDAWAKGWSRRGDRSDTS